MKIENMFPSKYLRAADLPRSGMSLTIDAIEREQIGGDDKYVLYFLEDKRGLPLNKTNAMTIAEGYGNDTEEWSGRVIHLRKEKVQFQSSRVDAIRVSVAEFDDEIPQGNEAA